MYFLYMYAQQEFFFFFYTRVCIQFAKNLYPSSLENIQLSWGQTLNYINFFLHPQHALYQKYTYTYRRVFFLVSANKNLSMCSYCLDHNFFASIRYRGRYFLEVDSFLCVYTQNIPFSVATVGNVAIVPM